MAYIQEFNVNVQAIPSEDGYSIIRLSQNENGRKFRIHVLGVEIPAGSTAIISGTKPDGVVYSATGEVSGDYVTITEDIQMTAVPGNWNAKIHVTNDGQSIATAMIRLEIEKDPVDSGAIPSDSQLDGIIAQAAAYAEEAKSAAYGSPLVANTAADMTDTSRVYVYAGSETGYVNGDWYYWDGEQWSDGGTYNSGAVQIDDTLSIAGVAADAKATGDEINNIKADLSDIEEQISGGGMGVSDDLKLALLQIASKVAYIDDDGQDYYDALYDALYPPAELVSISAVYTQSGTVYDTDTLDSLKADLVVTATYEDSTTATITNYTLSGTLEEGTSTITVSYGGKTDTFEVTVTEAPPYTFYDYIEGDGTAFIDTGLSAKTYGADSYKKYIKFRMNAIQNEKVAFGVRNAWGTTGFLVQTNTSAADRLAIVFGNAWTKSSDLAEGDLTEIELDYPSVKKDGETIGTVSNATVAITSDSAIIPLFCMWGGSSGSGAIAYSGGYVSQFFPHKIYRFTVTDKSTGTVIADLKPAKRISDDAIGMYDSVRDQFYANARETGVFTLGNDGA